MRSDIMQPQDSQEHPVVLVDADDRPLGVTGKWQAHLEGLRHRAVSVFLFNRSGHLLLQQRSPTKYHSPLLWANACCSHPFPDEPPLKAASRRLREELGIEMTPESLRFDQIVTYDVDVGQGLKECEVTHVFVGRWDAPIDTPVPEEVSATRWISLEALHKEIDTTPEIFGTWFLVYRGLPGLIEGMLKKLP